MFSLLYISILITVSLLCFVALKALDVFKSVIQDQQMAYLSAINRMATYIKAVDANEAAELVAKDKQQEALLNQEEAEKFFEEKIEEPQPLIPAEIEVSGRKFTLMS